MNPLLQKLTSQADLNLEQLEIGFGTHGMSFSAKLDCEAPSLSTLLGDLGLEVPNDGLGLIGYDIQLSLGYERSRGPQPAAYQTIVKVTITGPLQLSDIFQLADLPHSFIPAIDKIELRFELDKQGNGNDASTQEEVDFQLSYATQSDPTPHILQGTYQRFTQGTTEIKGIAGTLHTADNSWSALSVDDAFKLHAEIASPFLLHVESSDDGKKTDAITIAGATMDASGTLPFQDVPVLHHFLKSQSFDLSNVSLIYCSEALALTDQMIANALLQKVGLAALPSASNISTTTGYSKGLNITGSSTFSPALSLDAWIKTWPSAYVPASELEDLASLLPNVTITSIPFGYHQGLSMSVCAEAQLEVSHLSGSPFPFSLSAQCEKDDQGKSSWMLKGENTGNLSLNLGDVLEHILGNLVPYNDLKDLPIISTIIGLTIESISFSYNTASKAFDFEFSLSEAQGFSSTSGKNLTPPASQQFSSFHITQTQTASGATSKQMTFKVGEGLTITQLLDLNGDPAGLDFPPLDDVAFSMDLTSSKGSSSEGYAFETTFTQDDNQFEFRGATQSNSGNNGLTLQGGNIYSPTGGTLNIDAFPLKIDIKDLFLAKFTQGTKKSVMFHTDLSMGVDIDLSKLPVIGKFLTEAKFKFDNLNITYSGAEVEKDDLATINAFIKELGTSPFQTPKPAVGSSNSKPANFPEGYSIQGTLILGDNEETIHLHTSYSPPGTSGAGNQPAKPSHLGKKYGPIILDSVGLAVQDGGIGIKFTGGLVIGPVTFDLIGFEITSPVDHFDPDISIEGLGLDIHKGALSLEGLMMKSIVDIPEMNYSTGQLTTTPIEAFSGELVIDYKQYNLAALGSYAQLPDGSPTIFLYAFLGAPLGGPPVFFVTGVAVGFGYNRTLQLPKPTGISTYPLIAPVMGTPPAGSLADQFSAMNKDFLPKEGAFWGAVGIRGESFKMVESFIMLDVQFNDGIEIDLIGISNMTFPKQKAGENAHPLAKIIIGILARYLPEQGILLIQGAFQPGTYVLNPKAHLTGGFAMLSIFTDQTKGTYKGAKGQFVFSIGGYATDYHAPSYYPQPQRIQLNWQVNPVLSVKASGYFAIVPDSMMAGGMFQALYRIGGFFSISASFTLAADFKINWKPYHYTANISLAIDVCASINIDLWLFSIHLALNLDLGANLAIWGPPFAGKGQVIVHAIVSFGVDVSFGDSTPTPKAIDWEEFSTSFLPELDKILTASVGSGLITNVEKTTGTTTTKTAVINPKDMSLVCHTAFPISSINTNGGTVNGSCSDAFGIAPMGKLSNLSSDLTITITREGKAMESDFDFNVLTRSLPSAMWEAGTTVGIPENTHGKGLIPGLACGVEIVPSNAATKSQNSTTIDGVPNDPLLTPDAASFAAFDYKTAGFTMKSQTT